MLCKKENQTKIYLCIADPCGLKKKSDDHGLCENDIPTLNFTRAYRPRHITIGSNSKLSCNNILFCFNIFTRYFRGIWWNIFFIKYIISNKPILVLVMGIVFSKKVYNLIKKVLTDVHYSSLRNRHRAENKRRAWKIWQKE